MKDDVEQQWRQFLALHREMGSDMSALAVAFANQALAAQAEEIKGLHGLLAQYFPGSYETLDDHLRQLLQAYVSERGNAETGEREIVTLQAALIEERWQKNRADWWAIHNQVETFDGKLWCMRP